MTDTIIKYLKLPYQFEVAAMLQEVQSIQDTWLPHYNTQGYTGEWTALPLRTIGGNTQQHNAEAMGNQQQFADTPLLAHCPEIQKCINTLQCEKQSIRVLNLKPNATIKEHRDIGLCYEQGEARIHIPLQTNPHISFLLAGETMTLQEGECWYMNFDLPHQLANNGDTDRIHLVIDCIVNEWFTSTFLSGNSNQITYTNNNNAMSREEKVEMLAQLKTLNNEATAAIIKQLEAELQTT